MMYFYDLAHFIDFIIPICSRRTKVLLISAVLTKSPILIFGLRFCLLSWRLEKTVFPYIFLERSIGVTFVKW